MSGGTHDYELLADYYQFYIEDEHADADWSEAWTDETVSNCLVTVPGAVVVRTARDQRVAVRVQILDAEPPLALDDCDHATETSIDVPSGRLVVAGCTDDFRTANRIELSAGTFRVRVLHRNVDPTTTADHEVDSYELLVWPGDPQAPRVLKRHTGPLVR